MTDVSKLKFSVVDVTKIVTVIVCFMAQNYSLKNEIHEAILTQSGDKQFFGVQIAGITKDIDGLNNKYDFLIRNELKFSPADKPKPIKLEPE